LAPKNKKGGKKGGKKKPWFSFDIGGDDMGAGFGDDFGDFGGGNFGEGQEQGYEEEQVV